MRVLYLFSSIRRENVRQIKEGKKSHSGFWGMLELPTYGIEADYLEPEQYFSDRIALWLRKHVSVYFLHLTVFWRLFAYDIVFTSTAFGTQFFRMLIPLRKPLWVMHDFSITGLIGNKKTVRQKLFAWMTSRSAGIVTLSLHEKISLEKMFPHLRGKIEFLPFGVDLGFFKPYQLPEKRQVMAVGLDPDRDWGTLIEACKGLDVKVVLVTRANRVEKYLPLPAQFEVRQFSAQELVEEYDKSAVVVIPLDTSRGTNNAMGCSTLFEGLALGKPVVVTRTRTTESYIQDGENGLLVGEKSVEEMRQAIKKLLENALLRKKMGENARAYALKNLDPEKCAEKLAEFFKKIYTK